MDYLTTYAPIFISLLSLAYSHWIYLKQKPIISLKVYPKTLPSFTTMMAYNNSSKLRFSIPVLIENSGNRMTTLTSGFAEFYQNDDKKINNAKGYMHLPKEPFSISAGGAILKNLSFRGEFLDSSSEMIREKNPGMEIELFFLNHKPVKLKFHGFTYVDDITDIDFN